MRYLSLILLCVFSLATQAQEITLDFRTGDHIYYMEHESDVPSHYQVCGKISQEVLEELSLYGVPQCVVAYDPPTKQIYPQWLRTIQQDSSVLILTPHLSRATSFKIQTNNRVFVFITQSNHKKSL